LVSHFVKRYRKAFKKDIDFVPQTIINRLLLHDWPGNVRELESIIQRAVLMAKGSIITGQDLIFDQNLSGMLEGNNGFDIGSKLGTTPLKGIMAEVEADVIRQALSKYNANVTEAAKELAVGKTALYDKMKRYNISAKELKKTI
jgi:transcriptional regulator with PAS, ATPase and Fis domain